MRQLSWRNRLVVGLAVVIAMASLFTIIHAQASSTVIYACLSKSGAIRIVDAGVACGRAETSLSWNQAGPQGPTGPQGPAGAAGGGFDLVAVDNYNNEIILGTYLGTYSSYHLWWSEYHQAVRRIAINSTTFSVAYHSVGTAIYYAGADCSGTRFTTPQGIVSDELMMGPVESGAGLFTYRIAGSYGLITYASVRQEIGDWGCDPADELPVPVSGYALEQFALPTSPPQQFNVLQIRPKQ